MKNCIFAWLIFVLLLPFAGFTQDTTRTAAKKQETGLELYLWPGLDKKVIQEADSLFSLANVTERDEMIADGYFKQAQQMKVLCDSLWNFKDKKQRAAIDSNKAEDWFQQAMNYLKTAPYEFKEILKKTKKYGHLDSTILKDVTAALIPQTNKTYLNAIRYNPLKIVFRVDFAVFLESSYKKIGDISLIDQAIEQMKIAIRQRPGYGRSYPLIARLYELRKEWNQAYENYVKAAEVVKKAAIFSLKGDPSAYFDRLDQVPMDTLTYVSFLSSQAECKIHLYEPEPALAILKKARKLTPDPAWKDAFKNRIEWIQWDDGNIRASEIRDEALKLLNEKKRYAEAKTKFISLLDSLRTERTKHEVNFSIAYIDFNYLKNEDEAVARMLQIAKQTRIDSLTGAPLDSMHQIYFNNFGGWLFSLGQKYLDIDLNYAYLYFNQAAQIACKHRGVALIQLAIISSFDPTESIRLCNEAMKFEDELTEQNKRALYRQLYIAYRRLGNFAEARKWFDKWNLD